LGPGLPGLQPRARPKNSGNKFLKNLVIRPASPIAHPDGRKAQQPPILALAASATPTWLSALGLDAETERRS